MSGETVQTTITDWQEWVFHGDDVGPFLQNMCSQDILHQPELSGRYGFFLRPQGRVIADAWIIRHDARTWPLWVHPVYRSLLERHLTLYRLRMDVSWDIRHRSGIWIGPLLTRDTAHLPETHIWIPLPWDTDRWCALGFPKLHVVDSVSVPDTPTLTPDDWHRQRRTVGWVWPAADIGLQDWMPLEAALYHGISYTKGCYVGQEVVAKATYIGHPPRRLMQVRCHSWNPERFATPPSLAADPHARPTFGWGPGVDPQTAIGWVWVPHTRRPVGTTVTLTWPDGTTLSGNLHVPEWCERIRALYPPPTPPAQGRQR